MSKDTERQRTHQWIASLAVTITCCASFFLVFAGQTSQMQNQLSLMQLRAEMLETKLESIENARLSAIPGRSKKINENQNSRVRGKRVQLAQNVTVPSFGPASDEEVLPAGDLIKQVPDQQANPADPAIQAVPQLAREEDKDGKKSDAASEAERNAAAQSNILMPTLPSGEATTGGADISDQPIDHGEEPQTLQNMLVPPAPPPKPVPDPIATPTNK